MNVILKSITIIVLKIILSDWLTYINKEFVKSADNMSNDFVNMINIINNNYKLTHNSNDNIKLIRSTE